METGLSGVAILILIILIGGGIFAVGYAQYNSDEAKEFRSNAQQWCEEEGGYIGNANTVGAHGGMHCYATGEHVHMTDVAAANWTHDMDRINAEYEKRTGPFGIVETRGLGTIIVAFLAILSAVIVFALVGLYKGENDVR